MSITFRPALREAIPLLIGVAGGTGSGKTFSALLLARGIAGGLASRVAATVSCVAPLCEMVSTTTSGSHRDAQIACTWLSTTTRASRPMRSMR